MTYLLPILWMGFAAVLGGTGGMHRRENVLGRQERRATWMYAMLITVPLIYFAVTRSNYYGDTGAYIDIYRSIPSLISGKIEFVRSQPKDAGFYGLAALVSVFAGWHFRYFFLLLACIQGFALAKVYRKHSVDFWLSMFIFVASTDYLSWMYNGIRQFTAAAIIFAGSDYIFKRKYVKAILLICFASLFHQSALIMIPIIFVVQGRPWNWKTLLVIAGTVVILASTSSFTGALDDMLQNTQYKNVVTDWTTGQDDGTNPLRVLVYSVPTILSVFCAKRIQKDNNRVINIACNMGIISTALYLISMVTSGIFIGRLPIYCSLYATGILLPWELKYVYGKGIRAAAIFCFVGFHMLQLLMWGLI